MKTGLNDGTEDVWRKLIALKDELLLQMPSSKLEPARLRSMTEWLRRELELESRYDAVLAEAGKLVAGCPILAGQASQTDNPRPLPPPTAGEREEPDKGGGKDRARQFRNAYIVREKTRGRSLRRVRSVYYQSEDGLIVGVTYSGEKKGTWFLNLQDGKFQEAVLLCETGPQTSQAIRLSKTFFELYGSQLSQDGKGQTKFNLARRDGRFFIQVPGSAGWVDVQHYVDPEPLVCQSYEYV